MLSVFNNKIMWYPYPLARFPFFFSYPFSIWFHGICYNPASVCNVIIESIVQQTNKKSGKCFSFCLKLKMCTMNGYPSTIHYWYYRMWDSFYLHILLFVLFSKGKIIEPTELLFHFVNIGCTVRTVTFVPHTMYNTKYTNKLRTLCAIFYVRFTVNNISNNRKKKGENKNKIMCKKHVLRVLRFVLCESVVGALFVFCTFSHRIRGFEEDKRVW